MLRFLAWVIERMLVGLTRIGNSRQYRLKGGEMLNPVLDLWHVEYLEYQVGGQESIWGQEW